MTDFTVYDSVTGEILRTGECPSDMVADQPQGGEAVLSEYGDAETQYVVAGVLTSRPSAAASIDKTAIQADGFDTATITGIPAGWTYDISNGETGTTVGGDIELTALEAGTFTLRFTNWPYQDVEYTLIASATPLASTDAPVGTPWRLHSNPSITLAEMKTAAKHEMHVLDDEFLARELEFLGCSRATFDLKVLEAQAYYNAGYPEFDSSLYPYLDTHASVCGCTPAEAAEAILLDDIRYRATVRTTEHARLTAFFQIDNAGYLETAAREQFRWRNAFYMSAVMGAELNKPITTPRSLTNYDTVEATAGVTDDLVITLPEKSLAADMEVIVEAFTVDSEDPWRGAYSATYTNPGLEQALTFATANQYLVTIRNLPRVAQQFVVDCRHKIDGATTTDVTVSAGMTYTPAP